MNDLLQSKFRFSSFIGHGSVNLQVEENEIKNKLQYGTVSEEKMLGKKMKVKVRDFIKRFNSEGSPKRDQKMRKKDKNKIRGEGQGPLSPSVSESNGEEKSTELKIDEVFVFASSQLPQVCLFLFNMFAVSVNLHC
jgi:hypothetical protein